MKISEESLTNKYQWRMTVEDVGFVIGTVIQPPGYSAMVTPAQIIATICNIIRVKPQDMLGKNKAHHISHARQIAMLIVRDCCPYWSHSEIGRHFGQHHTTVLYGVQQAKRRIGEGGPCKQIYLKACGAMKIAPVRIARS